MPRRLRTWIDSFFQLTRLRDFLTARTQRVTKAARSQAKRLRRVVHPLMGWLWGRSAPGVEDEKVRPAKLELRAMDWRNPPSESIAQTALPLAAAAAAATAAIYFAATLEAHNPAPAAAATPRGDGYDTTPPNIPAFTLNPESEIGGGNPEEQLLPESSPAQAVAPEETDDAAVAAVDGAGSTLHQTHEDEFGQNHSAGGGGGGGGAGSTMGTDTAQGGSGGSFNTIDNDNVPISTGFSGNGPGFDPTRNNSTFFPNFAAARNVATSTSEISPGSNTDSSTGENGHAGNTIGNDIPATGGNTNGGGNGGGQPPVEGPSGGSVLLASTENQPVRFIANDGQWDSSVDFGVQGTAYQVAIGRDAFSVVLPRATRGEQQPDGGAVADVVRVEWAGVHAETRATGEGRLTSVSNFLLGNDPARWRTNVAEYSAVRYADAWDGIDLVYRQGPTGQVEYDIVVDPGVSAEGVGFSVRGADARVDELGRLVLTTSSGAEFIQQAPVLYQTAADGARRNVFGGYALRPDGSIGFSVGAYDPTRELVIDPVLHYSVGVGDAPSIARAVAADIGIGYVAGQTDSMNLPATTGTYDPTISITPDAFVTMADGIGNPVWSTYLGGDSWDESRGIALGPDGGIFVVGDSRSYDFPTTPGAYQTTSDLDGYAFLTKLSADGTALTYSTYLGGTGQDYGYGVAVDQSNGEAVIVGYTQTEDFPTVNAFQAAIGTSGGTDNAFVARFNSTGSALVFSTYLNGTNGESLANAVALDSAGRILVAGTTTASTFPTVLGYDSSLGGTSDAFMARFTATGALDRATFFGGTGAEGASGIAVDAFDAVYVVGGTSSSNFPTVNPIQGTFGGGADAFVAKFNDLSSSPAYSTYRGGAGSDSATAVSVTASGQAFVAGFGFLSRYTADGSAIDWSPTATGLNLYACAIGRGTYYFAAGENGAGLLRMYGPLPSPQGLWEDDTGVSDQDYLTYDTSPTFFGTAYPNSTVGMFIGLTTDNDYKLNVGTTTADFAGNWTLTYSGHPIPPDGVYHLTIYSTFGGETTYSDPWYTKSTYILDTVPPQAKIRLPDGATTYDTKPQIVVTASDLWGFHSGMTVVLDADRNGDGDFDDSGELNFDTSSLQAERAVFTNYPALTVGVTTMFRARLLDLAGNEGTSVLVPVTVLASPNTSAATSLTPALRSGYGGMYGWTNPGDALLYAGNVTTSHQLDLDMSYASCGCQDPYLIYNSQEAAPAPVVQAVLRSDNALGMPNAVVGTLTWDGVVVGSVSYDLSALSPGGNWVFGYQPTSNLGTGRHTYTLDLSFDYAGTLNDFTRSVGGQTFLVNRSDSPYGAGWSFSNTDTLIPISASGSYPAGILRLFGRGGWAFYQDTGGGNYTEPPGDPGTLVASGGGWIYTAYDGKVLNFDSSGRMTTWTSADGTETLTYTYDGGTGTATRIATMTGPDGGVATFTYSSGLLATIESPGSRTVTATITSNDLVTIANPAGDTHDLTYTSHRLTGETYRGVAQAYTYQDGLAQTVQLGTDPVGTIVAALSAGVGKAATATPANGVGGSYTDPRGSTTGVWFNVFGQPVQKLASDGGQEFYTRDANGYVTGYQDALGRSTTYTVNSKGQVEGVTRADSSTTSASYAGANSALTGYADYRGGLWTYTNDVYGRQETAKNPLGEITSYTYDNGLLKTVTDALGNVTTYLYDAARRPTGALVGGAVTGTVGYDARGNPNTFTDALGNVTTTIYDLNGRVTSVIDPLGHITTSTYSTTGQLLSTTDAVGNTTSYGYDASGRVEVVIRGYGTGLAQRTTSVYDAVGNLIATIDPLGHRTTSVYDSENRIIATIDALGNTSATQYDLAGQVLTTIDPLGRVTRYGYDSLGREVSVTDALGNTTTTVYDADSNVIATVDPLGHRSTSVYDAAGQLIASVDALGNTTSYGYDAAGRQVTMTDPLGHVSTTVYDVRSRVEATIDAMGKRTTTVYDVADRVVATIDPNGNRTTSVYDNASRVIAAVDALNKRSTTVYDDADRVIATVDALGNRTTTVYDALSREEATIDALNHRTTSVYDGDDRLIARVDALGNRTTSVYDDADRVVASVDALGNRSTTVYDAAGNVIASVDALGRRTTYALDGLNRVIAMTDALGNVSSVSYDVAGRMVTSTDALGRVTTFVYDDADRSIATMDARGNRSTMVYDAASNAIAFIDARGNRSTNVYDALNRVEATIDALNHRTTFVYDDAGNMIAMVDALGHRTTGVYDALNRVEATINALGHRTTSAFDAAGNRIATIDALGHRTTAIYDALNRVQATVDALGNRTTTTFDAAGNVRTTVDALNRTTTFGYDARNMPVTTTDALGNVWTTQYDALGRAWRQIDPLGHDTRTYFDEAGRVVETADALGNRRSTVYDAAGNPIASVDPLGNRTTSVYDALNRVQTTVDALGGRTTFGYDAMSNRTFLTDPAGNTTTWVYDAVNRISTETDPTGANSTFTYDAAGRLTSEADRLGRRRDFGYDALDRKISETWVTSGIAVQTQTWDYDAAGRLTSVADPDGVYTLGYDEINRVTSVQEPFGLTLTFGYDAVGNRTLIQDSKGGTTTVTFDAVNRQLTEELGGTGITGVQQTRGYDAAGRLTSETRLTVISSVWTVVGTTIYDYDVANRETGITHKNGSGTVLTTYVYAYDAADRLTSEAINGSLRTYTYDNTNQLTGDAGTTYSYDANGNRNMSGYATDPANRVRTDGTWTYTYDAEGNVVKMSKGAASDTWTYAYDHRNQMVGASYATTDGGTVTQRVTYAYDAFGNKIERDAWDGVTTTVGRYGLDGWDPAKPAPVGTENFDAWVDMNSSNTLTMRRVFGVGFDDLTLREDGVGNVGWYLPDRLGSMRGITDEAGVPLTTVSYDGWGKVLANSTPAQSDRYQFTGREWDAALGLRDHRVRFTNGAFWYAEDPKGFDAGDANLRRVVGNSPTNGIDPSGLITPVAAGKIILEGLGVLETVFTFGQLVSDQPSPLKLGADVKSKWYTFKVESTDARDAIKRLKKTYPEYAKNCLTDVGIYFVVSWRVHNSVSANDQLGYGYVSKTVKLKDIDLNKEFPIGVESPRWRFWGYYESSTFRGSSYIALEHGVSGATKAYREVGKTIDLQIMYRLYVVNMDDRPYHHFTGRYMVIAPGDEQYIGSRHGLSYTVYGRGEMIESKDWTDFVTVEFGEK